MRWFLGLWVLPMSFLVSWFVLASNDWSFGTFFFSRAMYDMIFALYGEILGVPAESVPPMIFKALALDTAIVAGLFALRRRKAIAAFVRSRTAHYASRRASSADSLSSAP